ncbi:Gfo/Idh/MocA family oxidoreductase [Microbacterium sp. LWS13-1.2]|uniref:Gfo/Idh/MocA family oxidoreductase n=1 Tax=Microbacterium sp. LWS13-1.2 TaxID=3135264 RepID=A0AAU6SAT1_9MICO
MKFGVLGAGLIATIPKGVISNIHHLRDKIEITAIADLNADLAASVAQTYGIPRSFDSLNAMLEYGDFEAVANLTPTPAHFETSLVILNAGKHLALEKPICNTVEEIEEIERTAKANGVTVVYAPPSMLYPSRREARRLLASEMIGRPTLVKSRTSGAGPASSPWPIDPSSYYKGHGSLWEIGVYSIFEMMTVLNRPVKSVFGYFGRTEDTRTVPSGPYRGLVVPVEYDDNHVISLDFGDSLFGVFDSTYNVWASQAPRMEIFGRKGTMSVWDNIDFMNPRLDVYQVDTDRDVKGWMSVDFNHNVLARQHAANVQRAMFLEHLVDVVHDGAQNEMPFDRARHIMEIMVKAELSGQTGEAQPIESTFAPTVIDTSFSDTAGIAQ